MSYIIIITIIGCVTGCVIINPGFGPRGGKTAGGRGGGGGGGRGGGGGGGRGGGGRKNN